MLRQHLFYPVMEANAQMGQDVPPGIPETVSSVLDEQCTYTSENDMCESFSYEYMRDHACIQNSPKV